jgi:hypothetical protein
MMSFPVCHERVGASPQRKPTYKAALTGNKKEKVACCNLLNILTWLGSATKVGRCQSARGPGLRACLKIWSVTAVGLALPPASLQAEIAHVANVANANVSAYSIGANGSLTSVAGSPFPAGIASISVAVDRFVYVANQSSSNISAYHIGDCGFLTPVAGSPFRAGSFPFAGGSGPLGPVRLRGKRGQQQRLGLPPR